MKRRHWWFFWAVQATGVAYMALTGLVEYWIFLPVAFLMLLPGSLLVFLFHSPGTWVADWSALQTCTIVVSTNTSLFIVISYLIARRKRSI